MQLLRTRLYLSQSDWWTFMRWEDKQERRARSGHTSLIFSKVSSSSQCSCTSWDRPSEIPLILLVADYMSRSPPSLLASRHHTAPMVAIVAKHGPRNQHVNMSTCTWILDIYKRFSEALAPFSLSEHNISSCSGQVCSCLKSSLPSRGFHGPLLWY